MLLVAHLYEVRLLKMECALFVIVQYDSSLQFNLLNSVNLLIRFGVKLVVTIITSGFKT